MRASLRELPSLTKISICFGIALIGTTTFQWLLVDFFTPFCIGPVLFVMRAILVVLVVGSVVCLLIGLDDPISNGVPLVVNIGTLLIIQCVPFTAIWLDLEFRWNWKGYNKVIKLVEEGEIEAEDHYLVTLPTEYRHLSKGGGQIMVNTRDDVTQVFFFTFRGVLDNFSGYMYRSDDNPPQPGDLGGDWKQVERKRPHWFFCASH
jgi:hypothetical protein